MRIGESNRPRQHEARGTTTRERGGTTTGIFSPGSRKSDYEESSSRVINSRWKSTLGKIPTLPLAPAPPFHPRLCRKIATEVPPLDGQPPRQPPWNLFICLTCLLWTGYGVASFVRVGLWMKNETSGENEKGRERGAKRVVVEKGMAIIFVQRERERRILSGNDKEKGRGWTMRERTGGAWNWREKGG